MTSTNLPHTYSLASNASLRRACWVLAGVAAVHWGLLHTPLQSLQPWSTPERNTVHVQLLAPSPVAPTSTSPAKAESLKQQPTQKQDHQASTVERNSASKVDKPDPTPQPPEQQPPSGASAATAAAVAVAAASSTSGVAAAPAITPAANAKLLFDVSVQSKGLTLNPSGELLWQHDANTYNARLSLSHLFFSRTQTSRGNLTDKGLQPIRFGDKVKSEVAAHFDWAGGKVTFSANTPDVALTPTTQDQLSALLQLGALIAAAPQQYPAGYTVQMPAIGPRSEEQWEFVIAAPEKLQLPGGTLTALKVTRAAAVQYGNRAEIWLAPTLGYLPVRIKLIEANGDVADMQWKETQQP